MSLIRHHEELDKLTPAEHRVLLEQLLYTMDFEQRHKLIQALPGLYMRIYPGASTKKRVIEVLSSEE